jgi:hypothetical protein
LLLEAKIGDNWLDTKDIIWYNNKTFVNKGVNYKHEQWSNNNRYK